LVLATLAAASLLIWIYILIGRGFFWTTSRPNTPAGSPTPGKRVVAVIPARNEAAVIRASLASLFEQDYGWILQVIVVDDASTDDTGPIVSAMANEPGLLDRLTLLPGKPLEAGWTGKLWALSQGVERALTFNPDYILLTDADIRHGGDSVRTLVSIAETRQCDLTSFMVKLACRSVPEKALIPAFVFFFFQLYPPAWISSKRFKTAGAAGGCILIKPTALAKFGGLPAIRDAVIDDCALARAVKRTGGRLWLGLTAGSHSLRGYTSFGEIGNMISRTAFNQLRHSSWLLIATSMGLIVTYLVPVLAISTSNGLSRSLGAVAWLVMTLCFLPTVKFYRLSPLWALVLPGTALFYLVATIRSAILYWRGRGGQWKDRAQDVRA